LDKFELIGKVPVAGLAKQNEELYFPDMPSPLLLPRSSQALFLIQRIRDEAHRFAITAHRNQRAKLGLASRLDAIPGIGPARRKALLAHFGSVDGIMNASPEELITVNGINPALALVIKETLE